jgi:hypothetical protein
VDHGQRRENPGEGKPQEGTEDPSDLTIARMPTESQGEQGPGDDSSFLRFLTEKESRRQRQEGNDHRKVIRLLGKGKP